jgi:DNA-binding response OmpR family regulator
LLIGPDGEPPLVLDTTEDWIRQPASEPDLLARIRRLSTWAVENRPDPITVEEGLLRRGDRTVALTPSETRLARELVKDFDRIVPRDRLEAVASPGGRPTTRSLATNLSRLRRRLSSLGLGLASAGRVGFVIYDTQDAGLA